MQNSYLCLAVAGNLWADGLVAPKMECTFVRLFSMFSVLLLPLLQHTAMPVPVTMTAYCRLVSNHVPLLNSYNAEYFMQLPVEFLIKSCCNIEKKKKKKTL